MHPHMRQPRAPFAVLWAAATPGLALLAGTSCPPCQLSASAASPSAAPPVATPCHAAVPAAVDVDRPPLLLPVMPGVFGPLDGDAAAGLQEVGGARARVARRRGLPSHAYGKRSRPGHGPLFDASWHPHGPNCACRPLCLCPARCLSWALAGRARCMGPSSCPRGSRSTAQTSGARGRNSGWRAEGPHAGRLARLITSALPYLAAQGQSCWVLHWGASAYACPAASGHKEPFAMKACT